MPDSPITAARLLGVLTLALVPLMSGARAQAVPPSPPTASRAPSVADSPFAHLEVSLAALPPSLHRRAVQFLERERERDDEVWLDVHLAPKALPMTRPGDSGPTYYEFRLVDADDHPRGYFVLATAEHDHPVPLSVDAGAPRSSLLATRATQGRARRVHFLSPVAWLAEGEDGERVASVGGLPPRVESIDPAWRSTSERDRLSRTELAPGAGSPDARLTTKLPKHAAQLGQWRSWEQLRDEYASNYAQAHAIMRLNAADEWESLRAAERQAQGLQSGWFREVPLLARGEATVTVHGAGRQWVRVEQYDRKLEGDAVAAVFVEEITTPGVFPVDLQIRYADGTSETQHFAVTRRIPRAAMGTESELASARDSEISQATSVLASPATSGTSPGGGSECDKVVLRGIHGTFLHATNGGGSTLRGRGRWVGGWEVFRLDAVGTGVYTLRASDGSYVQAAFDGGSGIAADGKTANGFTRLRRHNAAGGSVEFRTFYKHQPIHVSDDGSVTAQRDPKDGRRNQLQQEYCSPSLVQSKWAGATSGLAALHHVRKYSQLKGGQHPNRAPCASGCGATAWAMLFGWADHMAASGSATWSDYKGLYLRDGAKSGPDAHAPEFMWTDTPTWLLADREDAHLRAGVGNITEELRGYLGDWGASGCSLDGSRFTAPHIMAQARAYVTARNLDLGLTAAYDGAGFMTHAGKTSALRQIDEHDRPVAIGIGWFSHYPLAFGWHSARYAMWDPGSGRWASPRVEQRFVVHMGWGQLSAATVPYDSWFAGYIMPNDGAKSGDDKSSTGKSGKSKTRAGRRLGRRRAGGKSVPAPKQPKKKKGKPLPPAPGAPQLNGGH